LPFVVNFDFGAEFRQLANGIANARITFVNPKKVATVGTGGITGRL
jgi:hypothetical protein